MNKCKKISVSQYRNESKINLCLFFILMKNLNDSLKMFYYCKYNRFFFIFSGEFSFILIQPHSNQHFLHSKLICEYKLYPVFLLYFHYLIDILFLTNWFYVKKEKTRQGFSKNSVQYILYE